MILLEFMFQTPFHFIGMMILIATVGTLIHRLSFNILAALTRRR